MSSIDNSPAARAKNFTIEELNLLTELVAKYRNVIENKKSGATTHKAKEEAWEKLTRVFNAVTTGESRGKKTLLDKWRNTKKGSTKKYSEAKKLTYQTGGGPRPKVAHETPVDAIVHDIIGERMTGCDSVCDSDFLMPNEHLTPMMVEPILNYPVNQDALTASSEVDFLMQNEHLPVMMVEPLLDHSVKQDAPTTSSGVEQQERFQKDWSDYSPALLKSTTSVELKAKKSQNKTLKTNEKWYNLADKKDNYLDVLQKLRVKELELSIVKQEEEIDFIRLKKKLLLEEHTLKIKQMMEEHEEKKQIK